MRPGYSTANCTVGRAGRQTPVEGTTYPAVSALLSSMQKAGAAGMTSSVSRDVIP